MDHPETNLDRYGRKRGRKLFCLLQKRAAPIVHHSYITVILDSSLKTCELLYPLIAFHCCEAERLYTCTVFAFDFLL